MTVSELIDQLKTLPPHLPVMTPGEIGYDHVKHVHIIDVVYAPRGWSGDYISKIDEMGDTVSGDALAAVIIDWD